MTVKKDVTPSGWYTDPETGERVHPDDAPEMSDEWFAKAEIHIDGKPVRRGRPLIHGERAEGTTLRMPPKLKENLRQTGRGWQSRVVALIADEIAKPRNRLMAPPAPAVRSVAKAAASKATAGSAHSSRKSAKSAAAKTPLRMAAKKSPPRGR
ncbi:MAG: BrnA antitoxin family protein [Microvirga sp.]